MPHDTKSPYGERQLYPGLIIHNAEAYLSKKEYTNTRFNTCEKVPPRKSTPAMYMMANGHTAENI